MLNIDLKQRHTFKTFFWMEVDLFMFPTPAEIHEWVDKARRVDAISHEAVFTLQKMHSDSKSSSSLEMHATPYYFKAHKMATYYHFLLYGAPKEKP